MKYLLLLMMSISVISCESKETMTITQNVSTEMVTLEDNYLDRNQTKIVLELVFLLNLKLM